MAWLGAAPQLAVLGAHALPILLITTVGGVVTLLAAIALARLLMRTGADGWIAPGGGSQGLGARAYGGIATRGRGEGVGARRVLACSPLHRAVTEGAGPIALYALAMHWIGTSLDAVL